MKPLAMLIWKWKGSFQVHNLVDDFWKKYWKVHVSWLWCSHAPNVSTRHKKIVYQTFYFFQPLIYLFIILTWTCIYLQKARISKDSWKKKYEHFFFKKISNLIKNWVSLSLLQTCCAWKTILTNIPTSRLLSELGKIWKCSIGLYSKNSIFHLYH